MDEAVILTEEQLIELCKYWQKRLRLEHWDIFLRIARAREFELKDAQGECRWVQSSALATIKILDHVDWPQTPFEHDMEKTLVHELLHLHFCPFDDCLDSDNLKDIMLERAIDHIAKALVEEKRKNEQ